MKQGYREQPPTDNQHSAGHLPGAAVDNQVDDKRKAESRSNDHRSTNDLAPVCMWLASKTMQEYDRCTTSSSSIDICYLLQLEVAVPRSIHAA